MMMFQLAKVLKIQHFHYLRRINSSTDMKRFRVFLFFGLVLLPVSVMGQGVERVKDSKKSYSNIIEMLRAEPGLTIRGTGDGGVMPDMYIRGRGTSSDRYQPLIVVDGVKTDNILYIQPEEVYSIKVIKDGTAAVYGMEGANGVIEIRTKSAVETEKKNTEKKKLERKKARQEKKARKRKNKKDAPVSE